MLRRESHYQTWRPEAFKDDDSAPQALSLTPEELDARLNVARREAYTVGKQDGHEEGRQQGFAEAQAARIEVEVMKAARVAREEGFEAGREEGLASVAGEIANARTLIDHLAASTEGVTAAVADEIVHLALALARQVVLKEVSQSPDAIVPVIEEALRRLPQRRITLYLNPADLDVVKEHFADELDRDEHRLKADAAIERGGCRLESGQGDVDATMTTRWIRVLESLGCSE